MKVVTIIGTRPEIIRLACVIKKLDEFFEHILVHTGQNWDPTLFDVFFKELEIRKPDYHLDIVGSDLGESMGNIISKSYKLLNTLKPDAVLILGDTNSALSAISAKRLKIPIFHMEAGNRCFDQVVPEEINRKLVDHISDINLPYTENSRRNLIHEGFKSDHIFVTGSPLTEVYDKFNDKIDDSNILDQLNLKCGEYFVWSTHREENIDIQENWEKVVVNINTIAEKYNDKYIVMSIHPRTAKKIKVTNIKFANNVRLCEAFGLFDYIKLMKNSFCTVSDSGTISEEAALLKIPAVSFRHCTERQEAIEKGSVVLSSLEINNLVNAIKIVTESKICVDCGCPNDYFDTNVSDKIVKIIASYVPIVNRVIYSKK
ncbi:UDP-N-acetylglucosamine 2-epimerase [Cotonvirus japonicus]|uniref:UDP-N-acetylglucosamine 2-epimerase n=1 Tax=Cotonvirus japonicus TaxID=2811091 RepID=A0ABM7NSS9_9VIRU|nr:UDP-N-acetylglucosamine 2-epimerase [Cotonvirus japonicus]BCS83199.1 UDP-N-acetylglucosamine 2-epimerase [Cotonvirus japonicus]